MSDKGAGPRSHELESSLPLGNVRSTATNGYIATDIDSLPQEAETMVDMKREPG